MGQPPRETSLLIAAAPRRPPVPVRRGPRRAGFSLVELMMVVLLMGVLAALALPNLSPGMHEQLQSTGRIVAGDLAYARSLAVANGTSYRFRFELATNRYELRHSGSNRAFDRLPPSSFRNPGDPPEAHVVELEQLPHVGGHNIRLAAVTTTSGAAVPESDLEFGPLGETTRADETIIWLAGGTGEETRYVPVRVNPVTGLATVGAYTAEGPARRTW